MRCIDCNTFMELDYSSIKLNFKNSYWFIYLYENIYL
jgi:hypothetical protein